MGTDVDVGIDVPQALGGGLGLGPAHRGVAEEDLPMQIALVHHVEIHDPQRADSGGGEVEPQRRAQAAGADHQHLGRLELLLPHGAHLGQDQVAAVLADLAGGQLRQLAQIPHARTSCSTASSAEKRQLRVSTAWPPTTETMRQA